MCRSSIRLGLVQYPATETTPEPFRWLLSTEVSERPSVPFQHGEMARISSESNPHCGAALMNWDVQLAWPLRTHRSGLPEVIRTLGDALDLTWREVKEKLVTAAETRTGKAVEHATTLLEHALADEGWLHSNA
jgi:hypothetical protein